MSTGQKDQFEQTRAERNLFFTFLGLHMGSQSSNFLKNMTPHL